ncbi:MAG: deoxyribodipyrimidine photo-lyase [Oligoflexia bacterium]|nr:deoxyribodipyrimidine photo-lyase [Oligoflexia bacterium]
MDDKYEKSIVWIRRDLRLLDSHALFRAKERSKNIQLLFIFDQVILDKLDDLYEDKRVQFIKSALLEIEKQLDQNIIIKYGKPEDVFEEIIKDEKIDAVFTNRDYEPYAKKRDLKISKLCQKHNVDFHSYKDHVVFEFPEIVKDNKEFYSVFTPYKRKWLSKVDSGESLIPLFQYRLADIKKMVFTPKTKRAKKFLDKLSPSPIPASSKQAEGKLNKFLKIINDYHQNRDFPAINGTSGLSMYIRFGLLSPRRLSLIAYQNKSVGSQTWLSELIWREFYFMILDTHPEVATKEFNVKYQDFPWKKDSKLHQAWVEGQTGFPIVDAAMRCLKETGQMHNRLRMVVANFYCRLLLLDWRKGERHFAKYLLDFDLSANVGGWQWSSGSGNDAAPYFRIFNPLSQSKKFDKEAIFIKQWCPELQNMPDKYIHQPSLAPEDIQNDAGCILGKDYPMEIIDYNASRQNSLLFFKKILS